MNNSRGLIRQVMVISVLSLILISVIFLNRSFKTADERLNLISSTASENLSLSMMQNERQFEIDKVVQIISRYNRTMNDSLKYAIANEVYLMSKKFPSLNTDFIAATITHESAKTWDPKIMSRVGAMGLMQVMPATGAFLAVEEGINWTSAEEILFDPLVNIRLGCRYLNELVALYERDGGLAAYNGGPKRAAMWIAQNRDNKILWEETRQYIPAVMELYDKFRTERKM